MTTNFAAANGDELIATLREKTIAADDATHQDDSTLQHSLTDEAVSIAEHIENRSGWPAFVPLLADEHPAVRLMAAGRVVEHDQNLAFPVLVDLRDNVGGAVASFARMMLDLVKRR